VVSNDTSATYCTIDPAPVLDAAGNLWLAWGSGYSHASTDNTIFVTRLDNSTGLPSSADTVKPGHALAQGHIEASYVQYHGGYYYLFWNSGGCCDGASSTYTIHVARSQAITGPYSGARVFYASTGSIHGPGHIGIYDGCGASRFTYHYYPDTGGSVLGENELAWGSDGWPVVGPVSTTRLTPCGKSGAGGAGGAGTGGAGGTGGTSTGTGGTGGTVAGGASGTAGGSAGGAAGDGGAGGSGSGRGGAQGGSGGVSSGGGVTGAGGGAAGAGGFGGPTATAGTSGTAGAGGGGVGSGGQGAGGTGTAGSGGTGVVSSSPSSGCSCDLTGSAEPNGAGIALFVGMVLEATRRRQRRDRLRCRDSLGQLHQ
jgi:hypothetical protein